VAMVRKKKRQAPLPPNFAGGDIDSDFKNISLDASMDDDELSAQELIDFSPVYRCLHIYSVLVSASICILRVNKY